MLDCCWHNHTLNENPHNITQIPTQLHDCSATVMYTITGLMKAVHDHAVQMYNRMLTSIMQDEGKGLDKQMCFVLVSGSNGILFSGTTHTGHQTSDVYRILH